MKNQKSFSPKSKKPFSAKAPARFDKSERQGSKFSPNSKPRFRADTEYVSPSNEKTMTKQNREVSLRAPKGFRVTMGFHAVREALKVRPQSIQKIYLRAGWESSADLKEISLEAKAAKVSVETKSERELETLGTAHQGLAALIQGNPTWDWETPSEDLTSRVLVLDGIEDVHNLGAVLRTAWLMGTKGIFIPEDLAVGLTPTVHKVACGGAEHVPVAPVTNFSAPIETLKQQGFWVFGLSHKAKKSIFDLKIPEKVIWAIGAEDKGLRSTTERLCDELVSIPQLAPGASYNASVATAMALLETYRQQQIQTK